MTQKMKRYCRYLSEGFTYKYYFYKCYQVLYIKPEEKSNLQPGSITSALNYNHDLLAR